MPISICLSFLDSMIDQDFSGGTDFYFVDGPGVGVHVLEPGCRGGEAA